MHPDFQPSAFGPGAFILDIAESEDEGNSYRCSIMSYSAALKNQKPLNAAATRHPIFPAAHIPAR